MTATQYDEQLPDGRTVADRLDAHGIRVRPRGRRNYFVPMTQALRGLIPLLLDGEAVEPMVATRRIAC